jgi:acetyltransferase
MERLFDWARAQGIATIAGQVLADNAPMLAFTRALGFTLKRSEADEEVFDARRAVGPPTLGITPPP